MLERQYSRRQTADLLEMGKEEELNRFLAEGRLGAVGVHTEGETFSLAEVVTCKLAHAIERLGVPSEKAARYADAILGSRLAAHEENALDWIKNEAQELFCLICDNELARIFLRNKEDGKEVDVGAVKPMLFPTTRCEVNVFRVIRPVVYKARQLVKSDAEPVPGGSVT
jgi:hypothetical protein